MNSSLTCPSENSKTGGIAVSTTSRESCPSTCKLAGKEGGCYAEAGYYTRMHWDAVTAGTHGLEPVLFIEKVKKLPRFQLFRHNIAGDLWHEPDAVDIIHQGYLYKLANASSHLSAAWTYTHHNLDGINGAINKEIIFNSIKLGFVVNVSTESLDAAAQRYKEGLPTVVVQPKGLPTAFMHNKVSFVQCPATLPKSKITCQTCGGRWKKPLCSRADRTVVVVFPAHGIRAKQAVLQCS